MSLRTLIPALAIACAGAPLSAQNGAPTDSTPAAPPAAQAASVAPRLSDRFTVHGYITQAWAAANGGVQFYGITGSPSTDFRYAAVQTRFAATPSDLFLVQLNHRRLGRSPITDFESDVNLNWAFYQRTFRDGTTLKVGRMPIPRGIYNELRSVGVALPTYRPPVVLYDEGAYFSETIDGAVVSRTFFEERPWRVEAHAYLGGWRSLVYDTWSEEYSVNRARAENALGSQVWLDTPVEGLRFGVAAQQFRYEQGEIGETVVTKEWQVSADATRERGFVRAEGTVQNYGVDKFYAGYVQLGVQVTPKLLVTLEAQRSADHDVKYDESLPKDFMWHRSDGVALSYAISPSFLFKVEHHWDRGIQLEQPGDPRDPPRFRYVIAGLSAGF
jgi:hypothetical protein